MKIGGAEINIYSLAFSIVSYFLAAPFMIKLAYLFMASIMGLIVVIKNPAEGLKFWTENYSGLDPSLRFTLGLDVQNMVSLLGLVLFVQYCYSYAAKLSKNEPVPELLVESAIAGAIVPSAYVFVFLGVPFNIWYFIIAVVFGTGLSILYFSSLVRFLAAVIQRIDKLREKKGIAN